MMELETQRLVLRVLNPNQTALVVKYLLANKEFVKKWSPVRQDEFYSLAYHRIILEKSDTEKTLRLFIFKKECDNIVIGDIGYSNIVRGAFQSCNLGYAILHSEVNKGYITEALTVANEYVFKNRELHRIEANVSPRNRPSIKVLEKLGFENEGLRKNYLKINGIWEDHLSFVKFNDAEV